MKKLITLLLVFALLFCGCAKSEKKATLILTCYEHNVVQELTQEETEAVVEIFNSKRLSDIGGVPACGFGEDVAIKVGNTTYMIAKDDCSRIKNGMFTYNISDEDIQYIHELFESYSGSDWGYN